MPPSAGELAEVLHSGPPLPFGDDLPFVSSKKMRCSGPRLGHADGDRQQATEAYDFVDLDAGLALDVGKKGRTLPNGKELSSVIFTSKIFALQTEPLGSVNSLGAELLSSSYQRGPLSTAWMSVPGTPPTCGLYVVSYVRCAVCLHVSARRTFGPRFRFGRRHRSPHGNVQTPPAANAPASAFVCRCFACVYQLPIAITTAPSARSAGRRSAKKTATWPRSRA